MGLPPEPPKTDRDLDNLPITIDGTRYRLGPRLVKDDCEIELTMEGASVLRLSAKDHDGKLRALLADESLRLDGYVQVAIDGIDYVLDSVSVDEAEVVAMTFIDRAAFWLTKYTRYISRKRAKMTRAEFIRLLCDEAKVDAYIPELSDRQPVAA